MRAFRRIDLQRLLGRRLLLRLLALGILLILYYACDWTLLRHGLRSAVIPALALLGHEAAPLDVASELYLVVDGTRRFAVTANCTYADLVLIVAPFCWRFGRPLLANLGRLTALVLAVLPLNVARVALALHWYETGASWRLAHDAPDLAIHYSTMIAVVLLALRSDRRAPSS